MTSVKFNAGVIRDPATVMLYRGVRLEDMSKEDLIEAVKYYAVRERERLDEEASRRAVFGNRLRGKALAEGWGGLG